MSVFDPFADMTRLRNQLSRFIDDSQQQAAPTERERLWRPPVDVYEDEDAVTLQLDLPAVDRESLDVQVTGEELVIRGERKWSKPAQGTVLHSERPYGQFHRAFRLGIPVNQSDVAATYRDGVLTIRLPKAETVKPRRIEVQLDGANAA
jgi:HSP20 family protein